jgi:vacuolar-type H+-ATPase subunit E/Vma4
MNLSALEDALLAEVSGETKRAAAEARAAASERLAEATRRASAVVEEARRQGEETGGREGRRRGAAARQKARELRLEARQALLAHVRREARRAVLSLRDDPGYPRLLDRLGAAATAQLGPGAQIEVDPPGLGGVTGRAGPLVVDYTLPALADRALDDLGVELEELWS